MNDNEQLVPTEDEEFKHLKSIKKILDIIDMMRIDTNQPNMVDDLALETAERWLIHCEKRKINFAMLKYFYDKALDLRGSREFNLAFSFEDIIRAWQTWLEIERDMNISNPARVGSVSNCKKCFGTRAVKTLDEDGKEYSEFCKHGVS